MWSCRLNKIKSGRTKKSIANSTPIAEADLQTFRERSRTTTLSYFATRFGRGKYLLELLWAGNILALVLALAQARAWENLSFTHTMQYVLFINWILLAFAALTEYFEARLSPLKLQFKLFLGFLLLQVLVLLTTLSINSLIYFGENLSLAGLSATHVWDGVLMHLSFGVLLGMICFRYIYLRELWARKQNSELNARIQAMQARIHPHFLFNSLNSVISLIAIDPDKAEQMLLNLSRLFRASFQELKLVSLKDEVELCQRYLAIEQIRLGERLSVEWKLVNPEMYDRVQIPLLTLQPLVENSIFHGVEKILTKSTISILIEISQNQVNIVITNPFVQDKIKLRQGHGIAVENVHQRLKAYYGPQVTFQTYAGKEMFTTVVQYQYK